MLPELLNQIIWVKQDGVQAAIYKNSKTKGPLFFLVDQVGLKDLKYRGKYMLSKFALPQFSQREVGIYQLAEGDIVDLNQVKYVGYVKHLKSGYFLQLYKPTPSQGKLDELRATILPRVPAVPRFSRTEQPPTKA